MSVMALGNDQIPCRGGEGDWPKARRLGGAFASQATAAKVQRSRTSQAASEAVWTYQLGGYPVLKKWLGYRQADRRGGKPLTDMDRHWFRSIVQRIAALLALSAKLDSLYQQVVTDCFTTAGLGISPEASRERRDAKKKKVGNAKVTPAMKPMAKGTKKRPDLRARNYARPQSCIANWHAVLLKDRGWAGEGQHFTVCSTAA
jgi:hypothetical protein